MSGKLGTKVNNNLKRCIEEGKTSAVEKAEGSLSREVLDSHHIEENFTMVEHQKNLMRMVFEIVAHNTE